MKNNLKITISVVASLLVGLLLGMIINKTFSNEKITKLPNPEGYLYFLLPQELVFLLC